MFAIVFEVHPAAGRKDEYLGLAAHLKPMLEESDGFLSVERFESRRRAGWILSLSLWRDEKSVVRWRSHGEHHAIQLHGRAEVFSDYHLRVGEVTADTGTANLKEQRLDETEIGAAKALGVTEILARDGQPAAGTIEAAAGLLRLSLDEPALVDHDLFASIYNPGKLLLLTSWRTAADAQRWTPAGADGELRHRRLRAVRDYSLLDRREAPQFCPVVHKKP